MRDQDWDAWIDAAPEVIDLAGFEGSSALVAALARIRRIDPAYFRLLMRLRA